MADGGGSSVETAVRRALSTALDGRSRVVLAVSGGVDSMVLLHAAAATIPAPRLVVATFDHGTGPSATAAAALVSTQAKALRLECVSGRSDETLSSEAQLRDARWRFLRDIARETDAAVCTAHTADDQIETVLMRILRDAGARGLAALFAESEVVRPLLAFRRTEIEHYARANRVCWIEDPSNASPVFLRNRVRHDVLPALRAERPSIDGDLLSTASDAARWRRDVEAFVDHVVAPRTREDGRGLDVDVARLRDYPVSGLAVLWPAIAARSGLALDRRGTARLAAFTARARIGARIQLSGGWEVVRSRDALQLRASSETKPTPVALALSHTTSWSGWSFHPAQRVDPNDVWSASLPADCPLEVRSWSPGDAMGIRSSGRPRKVKELLSAAGITGHERAAWPVVVAGKGVQSEIVWVPGVRRCDAAPGPAGRSGLSFVCEYANR